MRFQKVFHSLKHCVFEVIAGFWDQIEEYWLKCHQIATCIAARVQTFAESKRQMCDIFLYRAVIELGLYSSSQQWYCYCPVLAGWLAGWLHQLEWRSESEMWSRYNGVLHRSAQNYWPLSRFFLSPTHPPQHPPLISSPSGQGFQEERGIVKRTFVQLPPWSTASTPLSFHTSSVIWKWWCSHASIKIIDGHPTRWDVDILNNWLASKHSLCNNFLLISNSPAYHAPFVIALFICILQFGYWKKLWIRTYLKQPTYWIVFFPPLPAYFHSSKFVSTGEGCCFSQWRAHCNSIWSYREAVMLCCAHSGFFPPLIHSTSVL